MSYDYPTIIAGLKINRTSAVNYGVADFNRVEYAVEAMADAISNEGYYFFPTVNTNWTTGSTWTVTPSLENMSRYLSNVVAIRDTFPAMTDYELPITMEYIDYNDANNIEKILKEIYPYVVIMINNYRRCNTFRCGQSR